MKILRTAGDTEHNRKLLVEWQNFHCFGAKSLTSCGFFKKMAVSRKRATRAELWRMGNACWDRAGAHVCGGGALIMR